MKDGFVRISAATPALRPGDVTFNCSQIKELIGTAREKGVSLLAFPELSLTGASCADLFFSRALLEAAAAALADLLAATAGSEIIVIVGLPYLDQQRLYNVAAVIQAGQLLGLVPKAKSAASGLLDQTRYFTPGSELAPGSNSLFPGRSVPFASDLVFRQDNNGGLSFYIGLGRDLDLSPCLPDVALLVNPTADSELLGRHEQRQLLAAGSSTRQACAYLLANAGPGESTTDLVFAGRSLIYENGRLLAESPAFSQGLVLSEIDTQLLENAQRQNLPGKSTADCRQVDFKLTQEPLDLVRVFKPFPFVPDDQVALDRRCAMILTLQAQGLKKRLAHTGSRHVVLGLSGGLDSTLAFLVVLRTFELLQLDKKGIVAVIMPGFGTTKRTWQNAGLLARSQGVTSREISIDKAVLQHFADIGHDPDQHDITYENAQARERTQILMDLANQYGGLVIGTGDLSELALGWCTYNADHMSMYAVNSSVPKTLIRHLIRYEAQNSRSGIRDLLEDIIATPVSPELLPPKEGQISQITEDFVGPYELHDFFLYYFLRHGFAPAKILRLASLAFER